MSTPTESETSESETCTRAYVALYAVVNDHVDPVDRDEYFARHVRYLEDLDQAGHVLLAGSFTDLGNTLDGFALFATPDEDEVQKLVDADPAVGPILNVTVHSWTALVGAERLPRPGEPGRDKVQQTIHRLFVAGVMARDPKAYFDRTYHPSVAIHEAPSLPYGGDYHGLEGAAEHALAFTRTWDGLQSAEQRDMTPRIVATDSEAFVIWTLRGQRPNDAAVTEFPALSHYQFQEGRVIESRMYLFDSAAVNTFVRKRGNQ
jgi:uncharacterized protein YciI